MTRGRRAVQVGDLDPADGRPVEMVLDLERLAVERPHAAWYDPRRRDLWRFGALMALDIADPQDAKHIVPLGEGAAPPPPAPAYRPPAVSRPMLPSCTRSDIASP